METVNISTNRFSNIHYHKYGSGKAVVLLHGFPEDSTLWENIIPALAGSYKVIAPDIPCSGKSTSDSAEASMEELADAVEVILEHEKIAEAVVAGHSMGGYISLVFAERNRKWLRGLSLVHSTATADTDEKKEMRRKSIALIRKGGREPFIKGMIPSLFADQFRELYPDLVQKQIERGMKLKDTCMIGFYNAMINRGDKTNILNDVSFPVQWITGKDDNTIPFRLALQQSLLAQVNFVSLYSNCGHMSMLEQPERLANDLKEFIVYCYNY